MSLTTGEMSAADLAAVVGNNGDGMGFGGSNGWWIILLFLCLFGGWGNNGGFGGGNAGAGGLYPWMNQADLTNTGFRDQMLNENISGIRDGVYGLSNQLCNGFGDVQMALANGFAGVEQGANARQMANMQTAFATQNAVNQGFNATQAQLASCCCENRLGIADLKYTVATENCADRAALSDGIRDIIASNTASTQRILDQLCQDKIDAKNDTIAQLRQELLYARGQASQDVQTAVLRAGQEAEVDALYNRLNNCPVGTVPVYGRQPIFSCNQGSGCGCNGNFYN
jgi:hypothetical protein